MPDEKDTLRSQGTLSDAEFRAKRIEKANADLRSAHSTPRIKPVFDENGTRVHSAVGPVTAETFKTMPAYAELNDKPAVDKLLQELGGQGRAMLVLDQAGKPDHAYFGEMAALNPDNSSRLEWKIDGYDASEPTVLLTRQLNFRGKDSGKIEDGPSTSVFLQERLENKEFGYVLSGRAAAQLIKDVSSQLNTQEPGVTEVRDDKGITHTVRDPVEFVQFRESDLYKNLPPKVKEQLDQRGAGGLNPHVVVVLDAQKQPERIYTGRHYYQWEPKEPNYNKDGITLTETINCKPASAHAACFEQCDPIRLPTGRFSDKEAAELVKKSKLLAQAPEVLPPGLERAQAQAADKNYLGKPKPDAETVQVATSIPGPLGGVRQV